MNFGDFPAIFAPEPRDFLMKIKKSVNFGDFPAIFALEPRDFLMKIKNPCNFHEKTSNL